MSVKDRLTAAGIALPQSGLPARGAYLPAAVHGRLVFVSGHTGRTAEQPALAGVVGEDVTVEAARESARQAAVNLLAAVDATVGLDAVTALLQLRGYVRASSDFGQHPLVIDAASELLSQVFDGGHARAALGVASLPGGAVVELEAVFALST